MNNAKSYIYIGTDSTSFIKVGYTKCYSCRYRNYHNPHNPSFRYLYILEFMHSTPDMINSFDIEQYFHKNSHNYQLIKRLEYDQLLNKTVCENEWYINDIDKIKSVLHEIIELFEQEYRLEYKNINLNELIICPSTDLRLCGDHNSFDQNNYQPKIPTLLVKLPVQLNKYQKEALHNWSGNNALFIMATGSGKTITAIIAGLKFLKNNPSKKILWVTHYRDTYRSQISDFRLFKCNFSIYDSISDLDAEFNIMCDKTMCNFNKNKPDNFNNIGMIIYDEIHNINGDENRITVEDIIERTKCKLIGFTATPKYNTLYLENHLHRLTPERPICITLPEVIADGNAPVFELIYFNDLRHIDLLDLSKKILIYCKDENHIKSVISLFQAHPQYDSAKPTILTSTSFNDQDSDNISNFISLNSGILLVLQRFKQGTNDPNINYIIDLTGVLHDPHAFNQMLGRLMRFSKNSHKEKVFYRLVVDGDMEETAKSDMNSLINYFKSISSNIISIYDPILCNTIVKYNKRGLDETLTNDIKIASINIELKTARQRTIVDKIKNDNTTITTEEFYELYNDCKTREDYIKRTNEAGIFSKKRWYECFATIERPLINDKKAFRWHELYTNLIYNHSTLIKKINDIKPLNQVYFQLVNNKSIWLDLHEENILIPEDLEDAYMINTKPLLRMKLITDN